MKYMKLICYCCFVMAMMWVSKATYTTDGNYRGIASTGETSYTKITASDFVKY